MSAAAAIEQPQACGPPRARLGKLFGILGSEHAGERANALAAIERDLIEADLSWRWVGELVARGELPGGERDRLFVRVVGERLRQALASAWAMPAGDAGVVRGVIARLGAGAAEISVAELERALAIADATRREVGRG
jgi:hypothetical protein